MALFTIQINTRLSDNQFAQLRKDIKDMALDVSRLIEEVTENSSITASAVTTLSALRDEIAALRDSTNDSETESKLTELVNTLDTNNAQLAAAIAAGSTSGETPAPTPDPASEG